MLGDKIKNLRKGMSLTQEQLCSKIGIAQSTLGMIESNSRPAGRKTLVKIADFFGVTVDYLISDNETGLNEKDKKSITKDLKVLMDEFREGTDGTAYYNGQELAEEDLDLIESAMKIALEQIKIKNKEKYTPNKYKK
ncbi:helix-turn-helix transcriptional regulator [Clostridium cadaveris]|uniref:helix-turn-helix domain-containing protein n=1 Tax=Clostridium cadaveris TaxID=1529 RepID=UPI001E39D996|nr:helix-turn-helix transcriptional regulator [Clostridium cadaveris]UFH65557.1 helix-turn-helix transcriptional regulator [Clostridium cadaveris]